LDAKRGKIFTQLIREITIGRQNPAATPTAILAFDAAPSPPPRRENMPNDNIKRPSSAAPASFPALPTREISSKATAPAASPSSWTH